MAVMTGGRAIMEIFRREGVEHIFGLPGSTEIEFMDALQDCPDIQYVLGLHENVAVAIAEGYSRISGKVAVVNVHTLAGLSSSLGMLLNCKAGGVPLLMTAGMQDTRLMMQESNLGGDLPYLAKPFTKWSAEITHTEEIPIAFRRAFKVAMQPPTGPVFLSLPRNIVSGEIDMEYVPSAPVFPVMRPDRQAIETAVKLLAGASRPVIITGQGVAKAGALEELVKLAELTGSRVYQRWAGDVNFPTDHPLYGGELNMSSLKTRDALEADVLVVISAKLLTPTFYLPKPLISGNAKIIQIDDNPWEIGKNFPLAAGISGHIRASLAEILGGLEESMMKSAKEAAAARVKVISTELEKKRGDFDAKVREERDNVPISVSRLSQEIRDALLPDTLVVDDTSSTGGTTRRIVNFNRHLTLIRNRDGTSIGWGIGGAIGASLAAPDRPVVAICGDGASMWGIQGLWTAAHYKVPVTFIVLANASYTVLKLNKHRQMGESARGRYLGMDFNKPRLDFCQISQGMGVPARRVEKPDEIAGALKAAFTSGIPNLVEVRIAESY